MQNPLILRLEAGRTRLLTVGERVRGEAIDRERRLLEGLERLLAQLQDRIAAEKLRLAQLEEQTALAPLADYDELTAKQVVAELDGLTDAERRQVAAYERAHKNRKTVLRALSRAA